MEMAKEFAGKMAGESGGLHHSAPARSTSLCPLIQPRTRSDYRPKIPATQLERI